MASLTVRMIEAIKPRDKPFKVTIDRGLQLRVAPDGRRTLLVRYTVKGYTSERQYSLPREYGDGPGQIKLADAKAEAARIRALARDGIDWPEQQAQQLQKAGEQRQLAEGAGTHLRRSAPGVRRTQTPQQGRLAAQGPHQGRLPRDGHPGAHRLRRPAIRRRRARRAGQPAPVGHHAGRNPPDLRALCQEVHSSCQLRHAGAARGTALARGDDCRQPAGQGHRRARPHRAGSPKGDPSPIPPERLGAWWNAARKASSRIAGDYYRFQLLTGCRGVEIHGHKNLGYPPLRVADVDLQGARVTLRDTKNRSDHRILLSRQALDIARAHCEGRAPEEPLFPIIDARKTLKAINAIAGTSVQGHGLRATFASVAEGLVSAAVLKRMMNHAVAADVTLGHYVAKSDAQLRAGWQAVADWIEAEARGCETQSKARTGSTTAVAAPSTNGA